MLHPLMTATADGDHRAENRVQQKARNGHRSLRDLCFIQGDVKQKH